jgi:arylsulfatase A-like enzyme
MRVVPGQRRLPIAIVRWTLLAVVPLLAVSALGLPQIVSTAHPAVPAARPPRARPDIVLITIDALRADHLSSYGYARLTSPLIDEFARSAVRFTDAIAQAPYTKASVASIMTGEYPSTHKTVTATVPFSETMTGALTSTPAVTDVLPSRLPTLAEVLHKGGYRTLGFTANPFLIAPFGFARGFEAFEFFPGADFAGGARLVAEAVQQVEADDTHPLFLWVHLMEPHSPYTPPPETAGTFRPAGPPQPIAPAVPIPEWLLPGSPRDLRQYVAAYDNEISAADVAVDSLLRQLGQSRRLANAVTVLTADHGEQFLDHGGWEHSTTLYEELIRVPLVIKAPFMAPGVVSGQVELIDLMPTLLQYAALQPPSGIPGRSLAAALRQRGDDARPAYSEIAGTKYAVRLDGWKLIASVDGQRELFDLRHDPREKHDLAATERARADRLQRMIDRNLAASIERGRAIPAETAPIAPEIERRLRALGYLGR